MKKKSIALTALGVATLVVPFGAVFTACGNEGSGEDLSHSYNVIATVASIPPVVASLESISNGCDTYAWIERGKTYSGIESVETFNNLGFDQTKNDTKVLTSDTVVSIASSIEQIKSRDEKAFINLYCVDYNAYAAYAMIVKAGLNQGEYKIHMIEDGSGAYSDVYNNYVKDIQSSAGHDLAYENYLTKVESCQTTLASIAESNGTTYELENHTVALALSSLDNFTYHFQSSQRMKDTLDSNENIVGSKLYAKLGITTHSSVKAANIKYKSISEYVASLSAAQKDSYITLMFGADKATTQNLFERTSSNGENVPSKKLVYIGGRVHQSGLTYVKDMTSLTELKQNYAELASDYKEVFATEADYNLVYNKISASNLAEKAKLEAINQYLEYTYVLKTVQRLYGSEYDILFKGHPRELVNDISTWQETSYRVNTGTEEEPNYVSFRELLYDMVNTFYSSDSEGKLIGILPGGVAAENFAYLGYDFALGGVSSSTYTGYEKDVIVEFIISGNNTTIQTDGNVATRYNEGSLAWTKGNNNEYTTLMLNRGNVYKTLMEYYNATNETLSNSYKALYENWLINYSDEDEITAETVANYTIDRQGNIIEKA